MSVKREEQNNKIHEDYEAFADILNKKLITVDFDLFR
jgi:hypothetical protein